MKLTYLLTLLLLLFSFTACGDSDDKKTDKEDTKVEDNKDKDSEDEDDTEDTEDTEDTSSEDSNSDENASAGSTTLGDISFTVNEAWTLDSSSIEGSSLVYMISAESGDNFIVQATDVGTELTSDDLQSSADTFIKTYADMGATLVDQSNFDTACGTSIVFTLDASKMVDPDGTMGVTAYIRQAIFVNGTNTYIAQLTCLSDNFDALSKEMDDVLSSITLN